MDLPNSLWIHHFQFRRKLSGKHLLYWCQSGGRKPGSSKWRFAALRFVHSQDIREIRGPNAFKTRLKCACHEIALSVTRQTCTWKCPGKGNELWQSWFSRKKPHAHKNRIGTSTPPFQKKKNTTPPLKRGILWAKGFPAERTKKCQAPIKLAQPFPAPELRAEIMDMRIFLIYMGFHNLRFTVWAALRPRGGPPPKINFVGTLIVVDPEKRFQESISELFLMLLRDRIYCRYQRVSGFARLAGQIKLLELVWMVIIPLSHSWKLLDPPFPELSR